LFLFYIIYFLVFFLSYVLFQFFNHFLFVVKQTSEFFDSKTKKAKENAYRVWKGTILAYLGGEGPSLKNVDLVILFLLFTLILQDLFCVFYPITVKNL